MSESLPAHFGLNNLHATLFTHHTAVLHTLVFTAVTFPIFDRAKDFSAKKSIPLRLERPIIDRFRLLHLPMRPRTNLLWRGNTNTNGTERGRIFRFLKQTQNTIQWDSPSPAVL